MILGVVSFILVQVWSWLVLVAINEFSMIKIDFSLLWVYYVDLRTLMPSLHYTNRLGVCYFQADHFESTTYLKDTKSSNNYKYFHSLCTIGWKKKISAYSFCLFYVRKMDIVPPEHTCHVCRQKLSMRCLNVIRTYCRAKICRYSAV